MTNVTKTTRKPIRVGSGNFISQLFFFWIFSFILIIRKAKDLKELPLLLRKTETTAFNDEILDKRWKEELEYAKKNKK